MLKDLTTTQKLWDEGNGLWSYILTTQTTHFHAHAHTHQREEHNASAVRKTWWICLKLLYIQGASKGTVVEKLLQKLISDQKPPNFVLCIGDDKSDEDMFESINECTKCTNLFTAAPEVFACTVGQKPSKAKYFVEETPDVIHLLKKLCLWCMSNICRFLQIFMSDMPNISMKLHLPFMLVVCCIWSFLTLAIFSQSNSCVLEVAIAYNCQ